MLCAAGLSNFQIIKSFFHKFSPFGVTGVVVIAESHFSIHTWPEHGYSAVDIFTCSEFDFQPAIDHINEIFESKNYSTFQFERGVLPPLDIEKN